MMTTSDTTAPTLLDPTALPAEIDELRDAIAKIEADLEFDDDRLPDWRTRAISALAHKRRQLYEAERNLRRATRKLPAPADLIAAKIAKNQSRAATKLVMAANVEIAAEKRRKERLDLAARMSFSLAFQRAAKSSLAPDVYASLLDATARAIGHVERQEIHLGQRESGADQQAAEAA